MQVIAEHHNVCNQLHMPAQSGASSMLARMKRGYTRDAYDALVARVRRRIPGVALSTDIIAGEVAKESHVRDHQHSLHCGAGDAVLTTSPVNSATPICPTWLSLTFDI